MKRRAFLQHSTVMAASAALPLSSYAMRTSTQQQPKISLAQWSLHRAYEKGELDPLYFSQITKEKFALDAVEYVASFYTEQASNESYWNQLNGIAKDQGVGNLLIMVDNEGELGNADDAERLKAVENHYKWVNAASLTGCHSIRVNAFGSPDQATIKAALIDGLGRLCEYASQANINILIENHGLFSSNAPFIVDVIKATNQPNLGTLPDFGNWCMAVQWGGIFREKCDNEFDKYEGVKAFLPYAKGVSAKSYDFDSTGNQALIDYKKMLGIVKDSGFDGYVGIEYEGDNLSEYEGIIATKKLIEKSW